MVLIRNSLIQSDQTEYVQDVAVKILQDATSLTRKRCITQTAVKTRRRRTVRRIRRVMSGGSKENQFKLNEKLKFQTKAVDVASDKSI